MPDTSAAPFVKADKTFSSPQAIPAALQTKMRQFRVVGTRRRFMLLRGLVATRRTSFYKA